ncbi:PrsW family intramembrane metalloprotease [Patescibacteria group bacterium]|nr:PrsW family intramembrane metalloprotease [Patescibacteria group bacterium]
MEVLKFIVVLILALIPALLWWWQIQKSSPKSKKNLLIVFVLGVFLSTGIVIGIQFLWIYYHPGTYFYREIAAAVTDFLLDQTFIGNLDINRDAFRVSAILAIMGIMVGVLEEFFKWSVLLVIDRNKFQITSINDALRYSLASALGFAFAENIIYFWRSIEAGEFGNLFAQVVLRSTLTVAGHLIFSGIAGYFYGVGKFAKPLSEHAFWKGTRYRFAGLVGISRETQFKIVSLLTGLGIAIIAHASFNALLDLDMIGINFAMIAVGILFILYLLQRRGGRLVLGLKTQQKSTMERKAEEVILELMGHWINKGKYKEVIEIGDRLLKRDPLNPVIHIFIAEAYQNIELTRATSVLKTLFTEEEYVERESLFKKKR